MNSFIKEPSLKFFNHDSQKVIDDLWNLLKIELVESINVKNFELNTFKGLLNRNHWVSVFENLTPIYNGMQWDINLEFPKDIYYHPRVITANFDKFIEESRLFFSQFKDEKIGVQLSGGLDSSIIICLLKHLKIPFYAIGLECDRYEFRTEKYIQEILKNYAEKSILINYEDHLPFMNLNELPPYQYPELLAINYSAEIAMAEACQSLGVTVLFTGDGGDNLFGDKIPIDPDDCMWLPQIFGSSWHADIVYKPRGINLLSFYAEPKIMDLIFNLRRGEEIDSLKIWARNFFKSILPEELFNFQYFADFWGLYISGFQRSLSEIKDQFKKTHFYTGISEYSDKKIDRLLGLDIHSNNKINFKLIQSRVAISIWINTLVSHNLISRR
jgi:hypothetical protein